MSGTSPDDCWISQTIGRPFPQNPVKVPGELNSYVAMIHIENKPVIGHAWNDCGVVQCAFAYNSKIITGSSIEGSIQILTYEGVHSVKGYFYEWTKYSKWQENSKDEDRVPVLCGTCAIVHWPEMGSIGSFNMETKIATFAADKNVITLSELEIGDMFILLRNTKSSPPHCSCEECTQKKDAPLISSPVPPLMVNEWCDYRAGDKFPNSKNLIRALNRPLMTVEGKQDQFIALWYYIGDAVMGRAWNDNGRIAAVFASHNRVFSDKVGSLQLLVQIPPKAAGFDYLWQPYKTAAKIGGKCYPVHIGFSAPCVLIVDKEGHECLGAVNLKEEFAEAAVCNKVFRLEGRAISEFKVLCRKDRDDTQAI